LIAEALGLASLQLKFKIGTHQPVGRRIFNYNSHIVPACNCSRWAGLMPSEAFSGGHLQFLVCESSLSSPAIVDLKLPETLRTVLLNGTKHRHEKCTCAQFEVLMASISARTCASLDFIRPVLWAKWQTVFSECKDEHCDNQSWCHALTRLHAAFVVTPVDKAPNAFALTCCKH
jgi:hypothetical protein